MKCPVCQSHQYTETNLQSDQFAEDIAECGLCGSVWAVNHGLVEMVKDSQEKSFLEALTECVEGDDYVWAGAC